jgi:molecular chaperone GrpE (heat shock protein)
LQGPPHIPHERRRKIAAEIKAYRERATKWRADAEKLKDGKFKRRILKLAQSFDALAESIDHEDKG